MAKPASRPGHDTEQALLDAAERLLVEVGAAGITTRRVAEEASTNHGLVHYYFGSIEQLLVRVLERFTERLIERQRELYTSDEPFVEKWRTAMRYLVSEDATVREDLVRAAGARMEQRQICATASPTSTASGAPC